jgi:hypothetical protein
MASRVAASLLLLGSRESVGVVFLHDHDICILFQAYHTLRAATSFIILHNAGNAGGVRGSACFGCGGSGQC